MTYREALKIEMEILAQNEKVIFLGQQVGAEDFYKTLTDIPESKRMEMPVAEELQMGMSIGMSLEGMIPVSLYQRMDFLPRAMDQLVNHLDLLEELSKGRFIPKVIIRTTIGVSAPMDVGLQHKKDLTEGMKAMLHFPVLKLNNIKEIQEGYKLARECKGPIMLIEMQDKYDSTE